MPSTSASLIEVLLATYNGALYLAQQIDSLLAQDWPNLRILARDDGSSDATPAILASYAAKYPDRFIVLTGPPTRSAKLNFLELLRASTAPYVAFSDQDDIWIPGKLTLQMQHMQELESTHGATLPLLVFSDLTIVERDLTVRHASFWQNQRIDPTRIYRFGSLLSQNVVTGCTALLNRPLAALAADMPPEAFMHDWWVALLTAAFGASAALPTPTVLYRQHGGNVLGAVIEQTPNLIPRWRYHDKRREQWEASAHAAQAFRRLYRDRLRPSDRRRLDSFVRSEESPNRLVRAYHFLRYGPLYNTLRGNLAMLWYVWDMNFAKRHRPAP